MEKTVKVSWTDKNFSAYFADEKIGAVVATGKTLEELKKNFKEAFEFHNDGMREDGDSIPDWVSENNKEFEWQLDAAALIRACEPYTSLAAIARASGINEQQAVVCELIANLLSKSVLHYHRRAITDAHLLIELFCAYFNDLLPLHFFVITDDDFHVLCPSTCSK